MSLTQESPGLCQHFGSSYRLTCQLANREKQIPDTAVSWVVAKLGFPQPCCPPLGPSQGVVFQDVLIFSVPECPGPGQHFGLVGKETESLPTVCLKAIHLLGCGQVQRKHSSTGIMFIGPGHSIHVNFRKETKAGFVQFAFPGSRVSPQLCRTVSQRPIPWSYPTLASLATEVGVQQSLPKFQDLVQTSGLG